MQNQSAAVATTAEHERDMLANAIADAAIKAGIIRPDASLTGPMLMMLCDDMAEIIRANSTPAAAPAATINMPPRMTEAASVQQLLGRFGVYGRVPADVATDIYNAALADVARLNGHLKAQVCEPGSQELQELLVGLTNMVELLNPKAPCLAQLRAMSGLDGES